MSRESEIVPLEEIPREYVIRAIENCRDQGRAVFDASHGKDAPTRYPMIFEGEEFTPKAIFYETIKLYEADMGRVLVRRYVQGGFKSRNGITRIVGRWGFSIIDRTTGLSLNPEDLPSKEAVTNDDPDGNEFELLQEALGQMDRPAGDIDQEIDGYGPPGRIASETTRFRRNMLVRTRVLQLADGICELCDEEASFATPAGTPYLEVHHVRALGDGGHDEVFNMAAICPNCHRNIHSGIDGRSLNEELTERVAARLDDVSLPDPVIRKSETSTISTGSNDSSSIAFAPYIGPRYSGGEVRLILIGESHYGEPDRNPLESTRTVVHAWRTRKWAVRFLTVGARVLTGKKAWEIDRNTAFDEVGFYNFVQTSMPTIQVRPTSEQARASSEAFREVLQRFDPTHLLIAGSGFLWSNMPPSDRVTEPLLLAGAMFERRDYRTSSGYACAIAIAHLSRASAPAWHPAVAAFKNVRP